MENLTQIKSQFDEIISHCYNISLPNTEAIFKKWEESKKRFIEAFDGKLIYEVGEINVPLPQNIKNEKFNNLLIYVYETTKNSKLTEFLKLNKESFFDNRVEQSIDNIPKGMKILKSFKYFIDEIELRKRVQDFASMILQEDKVEGTLCFSVHPLDFLSLSENCHNWRSCHALDGEFAEGNLSYMMDSSTVICYIKSKRGDVFYLPNFPKTVPWNSKKWRMLLFMSDKDNAMFAGRQYPFDIEGILPKISSRIIKLLNLNYSFSLDFAFEELLFGNSSKPKNENENKNDDNKSLGWSDWNNDYFSTVEGKYLRFHYCIMNEQIYPLSRDFITDAKHSQHFNDLLNSSVYNHPYYCYNFNNFNTIHFSLGSKIPCLECGKNHASELMRCKSCVRDYETDNDNVLSCNCCGRYIYLDEENYHILWDGTAICFNCDQDITQCGICGYYDYKDYMTYDANKDSLICTGCQRERR